MSPDYEIKFCITLSPFGANDNTKNAAKGERSIIPKGGITRLKGSKNGSHNLVKIDPICDSLAFGNQLMKI